MVVTRRQTADPLPPVASRTNSASGSTRSKGKGVPSVKLKEPEISPTRFPPNGTPSKTPTVGSEALEEVSIDDRVPFTRKPPPKQSNPLPNSKTKQKKSIKTKKRHPNKGISIFDILGRLFLLWFTIYSLSVCPDDVQLRSPICRALTEYRRVILEPFIYPTVRTALEHPSIAPHIQRAHPYYNRAVQTTKPWINRGKYEWRTKVAPRVQWLQLRARPYVRRMERRYDRTLGPYVQQASEVVAQYKAKAAPYILSATLKTRRTWRRANPYVRPLLRGISHVPGILTRLIGGPLRDARRQWVDPQVAKIWAAVVEKGRADTINVKTMSTTTSGSASTSTSKLLTPSILNNESPTPIINVSNLLLEDVSASTSDSVSTSPPLPERKDEAAWSVSSVILDNTSLASSSTSMASTVPKSDIPESSPEGSPLVDSSIPKPTEEAAVSASSVIKESLLQSSITPSSSSSQFSSEPSWTSVDPLLAEEEEAIEDLEEFLAEIGLNDDPSSDDSPQSPPVPQETQETEEEAEERLRLKATEIAEKRADIEGRHTQWEMDLETFGKGQRKVVRAALNRLREAAVEEARAPDAAIRMHVDGLLQEAEKSLKALKAYTRKLAAENKSEDEKIKVWENVVNKVDKKFTERLEAAADDVREWWSAYVDTEIKVVLAIGAQVTELADRAQADLGMDYSWLGDVTYEDWQRYHKLIATSKEFTDLYIAMQNGTHKTAPANPLIDIMEALQEEVDDMVLGFEANLTRVKNTALGMFSGIEANTITNIPEAAAEPEASILPIDPITGEKKIEEIPPVILSRGAEEIEAAMSRADEAKTNAAHEEL